jgi:hypothetical protein
LKTYHKHVRYKRALPEVRLALKGEGAPYET